jgi:hypothetical protein
MTTHSGHSPLKIIQRKLMAGPHSEGHKSLLALATLRFQIRDLQDWLLAAGCGGIRAQNVTILASLPHRPPQLAVR